MPVLMGKLDTSVNGPEGLPSFDGDAWDCVDWRHHEGQVRRLRGRIFKAVREGDWPSARSLQKLMLRSWSNTLVSVRQATQRNTGRRTAGIDELVALTSQARAEMAVQVHATIGSHQPSPVRRVYIPKAGDKAKMRPLGIPVLADRCHQGRVRNALDPVREIQTGVDTGRRPGSCIRQDQPRVPAGNSWRLPREGNDCRVAESGDLRGWERVRTDRGGNSPGRGDIALATEYRIARAGGGRRRPLPDRRSRRGGEGRLPGAH